MLAAGRKIRVNNKHDKIFTPRDPDDILRYAFVERVSLRFLAGTIQLGEKSFHSRFNSYEHFANSARYGVSFTDEVCLQYS